MKKSNLKTTLKPMIALDFNDNVYMSASNTQLFVEWFNLAQTTFSKRQKKTEKYIHICKNIKINRRIIFCKNIVVIYVERKI